MTWTQIGWFVLVYALIEAASALPVLLVSAWWLPVVLPVKAAIIVAALFLFAYKVHGAVS